MLRIYVPKCELWDEVHEEFIRTKAYTLRLEHSLVSISKWEAKHHISFFVTKLSGELLLSYIKCMTLNPDAPDNVYMALTNANLKAILDYINDPMTASKVSADVTRVGRDDYVTSELVYYWMTKYNIPAEYEKWHINRLIMLIRICIEKEKPPKKMTQAELYARHAAINARNKARFSK